MKLLTFLIPQAKAFVVWVFRGNDGNHVKRAIMLALLLSSFTACGLMAYYILHLSNHNQKTIIIKK